MKKTDIREGVTYRNKTGSACREVLSITADPKAVKASTRLYGCICDPAPWVVYTMVRGPELGETAASTLAAFSRWAYSEDAGAPAGRADLAARISQLEADKAALMDVVRAGHIAMTRGTTRQVTDYYDKYDALPAHLKEAAKEEAR